MDDELPIGPGSMLEVALLSPVVAGILQTTVDGVERLWSVPDPAALAAHLGRGLLGRSPAGEGRFREIGLLDSTSGALVLPSRTIPEDGGFAALDIITLQPAGRAVGELNAAVVDLHAALVPAIEYAISSGTMLVLELGSAEQDVVPWVRMFPRNGQISIWTSPAPREAPIWAPLIDDRDECGGLVPQTETGIRDAAALAAQAFTTWNVSPWDVALTFVIRDQAPAAVPHAEQAPGASAARSAIGVLNGQINVVPQGGGSWTVARLGLGPWAARMVLTDTELLIESRLPGVLDPQLVEGVLAEYPFPTPEVEHALAPGPTVVTLRYRVPYASMDPGEVQQAAFLLATSTSALASSLWVGLSPMERARLATYGIRSQEEAYSVPGVLLESDPVPDAEWDGTPALVDLAQPAEAPLPAGVAGVILGPLGPAWDSPIEEIRDTIATFTTTMTVEVQRTARGDEIYVQVAQENGFLFAEAISNTYLEGASRLTPTDVQRLHHLGWADPVGDDMPNFHRTFPDDDALEVATQLARTLRDAYGVDPDADGWMISWADAPPSKEKPPRLAAVPTAEPVAEKQAAPVKKAAISKKAAAKKAPPAKKAPALAKKAAPAPPVLTGPIAEYLDSVGATHITTPSAEVARFRIDGIGGVVRQTGPRMLAARFHIVGGADPDRAKRFADRQSLVGKRGRVEAIEDDGKASLVLTIRGSVDERDHFASGTPETIRALAEGWNAAGRGMVRLRRTLGTTGIAVPHLGSVKETHIDQYREWHWGSRYLDPFDLYMFDIGTVAAQLTRRGHLFTLAHAGHGMNSYGLNLVASAGDVAVLAQHGWGGAYTEPVQSLFAINQTYARLHVLLREAAKTETTKPRWLICLSTFRGVTGIVDLERWRPGGSAGMEEFEHEADLFGAVAGRIPGAHFGFANASVDW